MKKIQGLFLIAVIFLSLNGLLMAESSMTIVDLPATGTDAAIGIDASKTYTHTFDCGSGDEAVINGVELWAPSFDDLGDLFEATSSQGFDYVIDDSRRP